MVRSVEHGTARFTKKVGEASALATVSLFVLWTILHVPLGGDVRDSSEMAYQSTTGRSKATTVSGVRQAQRTFAVSL